MTGKIHIAGVLVASGTLLAAVAGPAEARCKIVTQTHNGTDFFYADGAAGTAQHKIRVAVEEWKQKTGVRKVKISYLKTNCGKWFIKYGLPHKHCIAKARVCY